MDRSASADVIGKAQRPRLPGGREPDRSVCAEDHLHRIPALDVPIELRLASGRALTPQQAAIWNSRLALT
jgi:hypothetical protein